MRLFRVPLIVFGLMLVPVTRADDTFRIVHSYPHDPRAFTQGLVFADGHLYESTGINGQSSLRMVDLETGRVLQDQPVDPKYFGEGLTAWGSTLVQLTWQSHVALVYDRFSFRLLHTFSFPGEGWGLTHDGESLILSDGTSTLRFIDPSTFKEVRRLIVKDHGKPVAEINELEYIDGQVYANIWHSDRIARISPRTGRVLGWIDLKGLLRANEHSGPEAVLNGIAWDAAHHRIFVTGKLWPKLFEIKVEREAKEHGRTIRHHIPPRKRPGILVPVGITHGLLGDLGSHDIAERGHPNHVRGLHRLCPHLCERPHAGAAARQAQTR